MFDPLEARRIVGQSFDRLTRAELDERRALIRQLNEWLEEREARTRAALAALDAAE